MRFQSKNMPSENESKKPVRSKVRKTGNRHRFTEHCGLSLQQDGNGSTTVTDSWMFLCDQIRARGQSTCTKARPLAASRTHEPQLHNTLMQGEQRPVREKGYHSRIMPGLTNVDFEMAVLRVLAPCSPVDYRCFRLLAASTMTTALETTG